MKHPFSERELIAAIRGNVLEAGDDIVQGIGDDCAVFRQQGGQLALVTTDTLVDAVHFDSRWHPPRLLGRKAAAVNVSDIAAMGGSPRFALLSLAIPATLDRDWLDLLLSGFLSSLQEHSTMLIGGDTVKSGRDAMLSVTIIGGAAAETVCYRSGARVGDQVWVSGYIGEAAAGLHLCRQGVAVNEPRWERLLKAHLDPVPQVALGKVLAASGLVHAMMDISDGVATDLAHICAASGAGAEISADALPISEQTKEAAARFNRSARDWALTGGEDYQLLFTASPAAQADLERLVWQETGQTVRPIGRIVAGSGVVLRLDDKRLDITYQGYDHFR